MANSPNFFGEYESPDRGSVLAKWLQNYLRISVSSFMNIFPIGKADDFAFIYATAFYFFL